MRMLPVLLLVATSSVIAGQPKDEGQTSLSVDLHVAKARAVELTVGTFVAEGLVVDKSEGGIISSIPVVVTYLGVDLGTVTYRATTVAREDSATQVQLIALWTERGKPARPIASTWKKMFVPHWERLERMASTLAKQAGPQP